jgi:hypothetical protein|eukprot:218532-Prymnesium_polylepis.3
MGTRGSSSATFATRHGRVCVVNVAPTPFWSESNPRRCEAPGWWHGAGCRSRVPGRAMFRVLTAGKLLYEYVYWLHSGLMVRLK